jgi:hypothetical protein
MLPKNKVTKRDLNSHAHQLPTPNKRVDKPVHMYMSQILALGVRYFVCIIYIYIYIYNLLRLGPGCYTQRSEIGIEEKREKGYII